MKNIILTGVGGQGVLLASKIIMEAALLSDCDVKGAEVHGMAQRGGSVDCHVRIGEKVHSPLVEQGEADLLVAFEKMEALRKLDFLKKDGVLLVNQKEIPSSTIEDGREVYPEGVSEWITENVKNSILLETTDALKEVRSAKALNVVMLGSLAKYLDFSDEAWHNAIKNVVKEKFVEMNLQAFSLGQKLS